MMETLIRISCEVGVWGPKQGKKLGATSEANRHVCLFIVMLNMSYTCLAYLTMFVPEPSIKEDLRTGKEERNRKWVYGLERVSSLNNYN